MENQVQAKDTTCSNLPLEPASGNAPFKPSVISEEHHQRILEETFGGAEDHYVLHNHVLCAQNGCKSLSSSEVKRQLPSKPHVFKHEWIDDNTVFCPRTGICWLALKEDEGMFCCLCKKHMKTGKAVKYVITPGTRFRKVAISEHDNSEEHKQSVRLERL